MHEPDRAERKQEKKQARIMRKSAYGLGFGVGLFLLKVLVAPLLGEHELAQAALGAFALCLFGYGAVILLVFLVKKAWLRPADLLLVWVVIPAILLKLILDLSG